MASTFTITEDELFNFETFCDSKYLDANCQKYGFFKVKLDASCAGQSSSMEEFFKQFGTVGAMKARKAVLLKNPNDKNLYGHHLQQPSASEKDDFLSTSFDAAAFQNVEALSNCCMKALTERGDMAFLQHFFAEVTCSPNVWKNTKDICSIRKKAVSTKIAYQNRQLYQQATSLVGKKQCLEIAMLNEKILVSSTPNCPCDSCNIDYVKCVEKSHKSSLKNVHGRGLVYSANIEESQTNYLHLTKNFAMAFLCFKNMLADLDSVFGGVSYPALYVGGLHSVFPLHTEDISCWSFNFLLHGYPKFWIIIPPTAVRQLTNALHRKGFYGFHKWCRNMLIHKFYIPGVNFFTEEKIPFELVIQREGEGIVLLPNAAHTGGNLGPNLAESCNFGTDKWIPYGCVSPNCPCMENTVHANLSGLIAVHKPKLLNAYLSNSIIQAVDDPYFHRSLLVETNFFCGDERQVSAERQDSNADSLSESFSTSSLLHGHLPPKKEKDKKNCFTAMKIKCPICEVSWAHSRRSSIKAHLHKYHACRMNEDIVTDFIDTYFPSK